MLRRPTSFANVTILYRVISEKLGPLVQRFKLSETSTSTLVVGSSAITAVLLGIGAYYLSDSKHPFLRALYELIESMLG